MKFDLSRHKKQLIVGAAGVCIIGAAGVSSLSYFSDDGKVVNEVTVGGLDLETTEDAWNPDGDNDGKVLYPGYTTKKNPTIQNITGIPDNNAYIRATVTFLDAEGNPLTGNKARNNLILQSIRWDGENTLTEGEKLSESQLNQYPTVNPDFELIEEKSKPDDGVFVYYLRDALASADTAGGGEAVTLFNILSFPTEWSQTELDLIGDFKIVINFEGIQEKTFANIYEAMDALDHEDVKVDYNSKNFRTKETEITVGGTSTSSNN